MHIILTHNEIKETDCCAVSPGSREKPQTVFSNLFTRCQACLGGEQARSQTMNTMGAEGCNEGAYTYISLYTYIIAYYTYTVYIVLCMHKRKRHLFQDHKLNSLVT